MAWEYTCPRCGKIIQDATPSRLKARVRRHENELHPDESISVEDEKMDRNVSSF